MNVTWTTRDDGTIEFSIDDQLVELVRPTASAPPGEPGTAPAGAMLPVPPRQKNGMPRIPPGTTALIHVDPDGTLSVSSDDAVAPYRQTTALRAARLTLAQLLAMSPDALSAWIERSARERMPRDVGLVELLIDDPDETAIPFAMSRVVNVLKDRGNPFADLRVIVGGAGSLEG